MPPLLASWDRDGYVELPAVLTAAEVAALNERLAERFARAARRAHLTSLPGLRELRRAAIGGFKLRDRLLAPWAERARDRPWTAALIRLERARAELVSAVLREDGADRMVMGYLTDERVRAAAGSPRVLEALTELFGERPVLFFTTSFRTGGQSETHVDSFGEDPCDASFVGASIALEDFDIANGPLFVVPGSHRLDARERERLTSLPTPPPGAVPLLTRSGDAVLWHRDLVHGSFPRLDRARSRRSLACHYAPRSALPRRARLRPLGTAWYRLDRLAAESPTLTRLLAER
ncbi:MAG: phytanoyl-CoA dioxygenase family protein [Sandaracinaceae bacterium]|nr:phytanoyl-CoA dioxygenase family protein [Sandaracinaceae bacterium]